jgi:hypothetical protein
MAEFSQGQEDKVKPTGPPFIGTYKLILKFFSKKLFDMLFIIDNTPIYC